MAILSFKAVLWDTTVMTIAEVGGSVVGFAEVKSSVMGGSVVAIA